MPDLAPLPRPNPVRLILVEEVEEGITILEDGLQLSFKVERSEGVTEV